MLSQQWRPSVIVQTAGDTRYLLNSLIKVINEGSIDADTAAHILHTFKVLEDKFVELTQCIDYVDDCLHLSDEDV